MNDTQFQSLLRQAEPPLPTAHNPALPQKIRTQLSSRKRRRTLLRSALAILLLALPTALLLRSQITQPSIFTPQPETTQQLAAEIAAQEDRIAALTRLESTLAVQRKLDRKLAERGDLPPELQAGELAAKTVIDLADVMRTNQSRREEARETYAGVIQNFPETLAAKTARQRLLELGGME